VTEILVHWHAGKSLNELSQRGGVDRKTIGRPVAPGGRDVPTKNGPLLREWCPGSSDAWLEAGDVVGDRPCTGSTSLRSGRQGSGGRGPAAGPVPGAGAESSTGSSAAGWTR
jgi:hypothetical protein